VSRSLWLAGMVVAAADAVALFNGARNQSRPPEAVVEMTERELRPNTYKEDNSGLSLWINTFPWRGDADWLDPARMARLGFDTRVPDWESSRRIVPRAGYVALEFDREGRKRPAPIMGGDALTRLAPIDADADAARLRARHPDRSRVIILRATFRVYYGARNKALRGGIASLLPASVSVPPGFRSALTPPFPAGYPRFAVRLAVGRDCEPYVTGVWKLPAPAPGYR
jgi:hypothetical protein